MVEANPVFKVSVELEAMHRENIDGFKEQFELGQKVGPGVFGEVYECKERTGFKETFIAKRVKSEYYEEHVVKACDKWLAEVAIL